MVWDQVFKYFKLIYEISNKFVKNYKIKFHRFFIICIKHPTSSSIVHFDFILNFFFLQLMKIIIMFASFIFGIFSSFIDYDSSHALTCSQINTNLTYAQSLSSLWNIVILHQIDRYVFLILTPFLIFIQIIFLIVFVQNKSTLFKRQGTIFFAIIIIQTTSNAYFFAHACTLDKQHSVCNNITIWIQFTGIISSVLYDFRSHKYIDLKPAKLLFIILYHLYSSKFKNFNQVQYQFIIIIQEQVISNKVLHSSVVIVSVAYTIFLYFNQRITVNQYGLCGLSNLRYNTIQWFFPIFSILSNLAYLSFALFTFYYFRKHMPVNDSLLQRIYHQNEAISYFVVVYSVLIMVFDISIGAVYFNCFRDEPITELLIFSTVMNLTRLIQTIFLLYFIMTDRAIKKKTKKYLRSFFQPMQKSDSQSFSLEIKDLDFSEENYQQLDITLKQKILELKEEQYQIDLFKINQISTMIAGICIAHLQYFNTKTFSFFIKKIHFKQIITFQIQPKTLSDYNIQVNRLPKAGILRGAITMVAPRIFSKLLNSDGLTLLEKSFDLAKNYHKMYNIAQGKGGKSGQFFFFSYDYKYVLKTITKDEFNFIVQNLQQFFEYYEKNPQTLLAKIYGLYTIKGQDIGKQYDLILMKNIFGCKKNQILRTYDIKGSKHDRQVIKQKNIYNQLEKLTLKDTDFLKLQQKLYIPIKKIRALRMVLKKDTLFLKNFNLIDYSLLIIRVKWTEKPENQNFWNQSQRVASNRNDNQFYHFGLIDYMQAWNISKKSENWFKSLLGKKQISAQQPNFYQKRFVQFFQEITYFSKDNQEVRTDFGDENSQIQEQQANQKLVPSKSKFKLLQLSKPFKVIKKESNQTKYQIQPFHVQKQISSINSKQSPSIGPSVSSSFEGQLLRKDGLLNLSQVEVQKKNTEHTEMITFKNFKFQGKDSEIPY